MNMSKGMWVLALMALIATQVSAAITVSTGASNAATTLCSILMSIEYMLYFIAAAVGIVVIVLQGIKWAGSAEDPGARKQAKQGIIHAIIGLIIVVLAVTIVTMVFTAGSCTATS
jgi:hypothetical protein